MSARGVLVFIAQDNYGIIAVRLLPVGHGKKPP
jgi:hypothetical protein